MKFLVLLAAALVAVNAQGCDYCGPFNVTADTLPSYVGPNPFPFLSSTGYVQVSSERSNFYWLVESQSDTPDEDPLVFWYQGGPGCSGLAGLFTEHGPFRVDAQGNVELAQFTWNTNANIVYLEQPTGVGFSFSPDHPSKYTSSDDQAAEDNFNFIEGFLKANPKFVGRKTWLAGESYGGVYIPTLTGQILDNPNSNIYNQLTGTMLGNPVMSCESLKEKDVLVHIFFWHQLISYSSYQEWNNDGCPQTPQSAHCSSLFIKIFREIGRVYQEIGAFSFNGTQPSLDPDDLYQDFILGNGTLEWTLTLETNDPDLDDLAITYLNRQDVQTAIHAQPPPAGEWEICTPGSTLQYNISGESMIPFYQNLIATRPDVTILVYSGDIDIATVPAAQTQLCLAELQGTPIQGKTWAPWYVNGATAGYVEYFEEYTYATVKGAGHTVPTYQPLTAYNMFERFSQNQNLDGGEIYFPPASSPKPRNKPLRQSDMLRKYNVGF
uniref:Carboxypeptidase n=1 Tax=Paramoeba aestuarina TaxID=180227 RepID=A0A7S4KTW6_9EUKA|eukprot:CAMPEP_0201539726 /NCGR_PEP_ID=MMETSP0161_2-20130828/70559_1 /ASSEMBLY_ACC=CAM_ASM_000251 /TAXON_ID=180227 /ORGANISM="Neoparamoeba aestuarina, Strain SoJaBio B1-5/56/2" /LENGTH=493 /DNA_ID=CAMNT_0047947139 /DNA_START=1193 /DNA_END=2674 /DNA_ORIENTATION=-